MRQRLKEVYTSVLGSLYSPKSNTIILNGHDFNMPNFKIDRKIEMADQLLNKLSCSYKLLDLDEAVFNIETGKKCPPQVAFTFDDGFSECVEIAEVFSVRNVSVGFFVSTNYHSSRSGELPLDIFKKSFLKEEDIIKIDRLGHLIGSHTHSHVSLNDISSDNFYREIVKPKEIIKSLTGKECKYFAPAPYGVAEVLSEEMLAKIAKEYECVFWSNNGNLTSSERGGINRRHFELNWSFNTLNYFLSRRQ